MIILRPIQIPDDIPQLEAIDASFETGQIYRVRRDELLFAFEEIGVETPVHKDYSVAEALQELNQMDFCVAAEIDLNIAGFATAKFDSWNRRAVLWHLYVGREYRGTGVGRMLLDSVIGFARARNARCLWLETQNINLPAIRFYTKAGFRFCGFDESLYDAPVGSTPETALFFALDLE